jgi:hypothetical protein
MTVQRWMELVKSVYPDAKFTLEDGTGLTYGDENDYTAHIGPDMQADVVGVFTTDGYWSVEGIL